MSLKTPLILHEKLFQVTEESSDGKIKAKCCVCPDSKPPLSGSKKANSNFLLHLIQFLKKFKKFMIKLVVITKKLLVP